MDDAQIRFAFVVGSRDTRAQEVKPDDPALIEFNEWLANVKHEAWKDGASDMRDLMIANIQDDGMIDQHVAVISGSKLLSRNPHKARVIPE